MEKKRLSMVADGWQNLLTGLGLKARDKKQNTSYGSIPLLTEPELAYLMRGDGFAKKIVSILPEHMMREGYTVTGDTDGIITSYLEDLNLKREMLKFLKWGRGFGGSVMLIGIDDGGDLNEEVNYGRIRNLTYFKVFDRFVVDKNQWLITDTKSPRFGSPEYYGITPYGGTQVKVHYSRVLEYSGEDVPERSRLDNAGWGDSILQSLWEALRDVGATLSGSASVVEDFITSKLTLKGLADMIAAGQEDLIYKRLDLLDNSKHIINTMLLDEGEEYEKDSSNVSGLAEMITTFIQVLAGVSDIPMRILLGEQNSGMNNDGSGSTRDWYDKIRGKQNDILVPYLEHIVELAGLSTEGPEVEDGFKVVMNPLWQATEKEKAETRKIQAETDALYIDRSVLSPSEVAISRFGGDEYSYDTQIDDTIERPEEVGETEESDEESDEESGNQTE